MEAVLHYLGGVKALLTCILVFQGVIIVILAAIFYNVERWFDQWRDWRDK